MNSMFKFLALSFACFSVFFSCDCLHAADDFAKASMISDLETIKHALALGYAPSHWKKELTSWNLEDAFLKAKSKILNSEKITVRQFQDIVKEFLGSTHDYHNTVLFCSTEGSSLPFNVKGVNGRYFITWVDEDALSPSNYLIRVGDELLEFDGKPVAEVVSQLRENSKIKGNDATDQSLAELNLTYRLGVRGDIIQKGPLTILGKSKSDGSLYSYQLMWNYYPEHVNTAFDFSIFGMKIDPLVQAFSPKKISLKKSPTMLLSPLYEIYETGKKRPVIGAEKSFVPDLGPKVWEGEGKKFVAYIYQHDEGYHVGYIRLNNYKKSEDFAEDFGKIIKFFEKNTDILVIDQVNNPGGALLYQYALLSNLTERPLKTPTHRLRISAQDAMESYSEFHDLDSIRSENDAERHLSSESYFKTYEYVLFLREFHRFIMKEWNSGHIFTAPTYLDGVDHINPHPKYRYTKPIVMLINELDFSGGDFVPAILQDNKRAILFGTRTAGAGGCVKRYEFPNSNNIMKIAYTWSIAERVNNQPIEDLGVTPDVEYKITVTDLQEDYKPYADMLNKTIGDLLNAQENAIFVNGIEPEPVEEEQESPL